SIPHRCPFDPPNSRALPVVSGNSSNRSTQSSPSVKRLGSEFDTDVKCGAALFRKMEAVAWGPSGEASGQRRWSSFEIGTRSANRIRINDNTCIAVGNVFVTRRRLNSLIIDTGVSHYDAKFYKGIYRALFQAEHFRGLAQKFCFGKIGATRVCYGWNTYASLPLGCGGKLFKPLHACFTKAFCISHDVCLRHRNEIPGAEERTNCYLVLERALRNRAELTRTNIVLFFSKVHSIQSKVAPESCTALPHLTISAR